MWDLLSFAFSEIRKLVHPSPVEPEISTSIICNFQDQLLEFGHSFYFSSTSLPSNSPSSPSFASSIVASHH